MEPNWYLRRVEKYRKILRYFTRRQAADKKLQELVNRQNDILCGVIKTQEQLVELLQKQLGDKEDRIAVLEQELKMIERRSRKRNKTEK